MVAGGRAQHFSAPCGGGQGRPATSGSRASEAEVGIVASCPDPEGSCPWTPAGTTAMDATPLPAPETLLRHAEALRRLGRGLLGDAHLAEDLAQETVLRWSERAPAVLH